MIKIIRESQEMDEDRLNMLEAQGLALLSVYHIVYHDRVPIDGGVGGSRVVDRPVWVYHFRSAARKFSSPSPYDAGARSLTRRDKKGRPW